MLKHAKYACNLNTNYLHIKSLSTIYLIEFPAEYYLFNY